MRSLCYDQAETLTHGYCPRVTAINAAPRRKRVVAPVNSTLQPKRMCAFMETKCNDYDDQTSLETLQRSDQRPRKAILYYLVYYTILCYAILYYTI